MKKQLVRLMALTMVLALIFTGSATAVGNDADASIERSSVGVTYYVDSQNGSDSHSGTTPEEAWKNLDMISQAVLRPGDQILLRAGSIWNGQQLYIHNSGTASAPIIVDSYGDGGKPIINGLGLTDAKYNATRIPVDYQGTFSCATVLVKNAEYVEINNLEVTNYISGLPEGINNTSLVGICLFNDNAGILKHLYISDCEVYNVNSFVPADDSRGKSTGGIITRVGDGGMAYQTATPLLGKIYALVATPFMMSGARASICIRIFLRGPWWAAGNQRKTLCFHTMFKLAITASVTSKAMESWSSVPIMPWWNLTMWRTVGYLR